MKIYTPATDRLKELYRKYHKVEHDMKGTKFFDNDNFSRNNGDHYYNFLNYTLVSEQEFINVVCHELDNQVFNPQPHYDNSKGSLYKVATERNWNAYLFDVVKRLERGGKKDPLKQEIEKSIDVLKIWLSEIKDEPKKSS